MTITVEINHHGSFHNDARNPRYIGGYVDVIKEFDADTLSFRDLGEFAEKFNYNPESLAHFKRDGKNMSSGMRLLYDDESIRDCIEVSKPYGKIELYIDHWLDEGENVDNDRGKDFVEEDDGDDVNGDGDDGEGGEYDDSEDEDYQYKGTESEESESDGSFVGESDEELQKNKKNCRDFREDLRKAMATPADAEFEEDEVCGLF
ncbi:nonsense-mediated mRNA decay protein 2-like [Daucus carota subsp. sativus]|uniref:nonsense-mediated mRNA decay protein 2-like n=1 Tax=Daucus carota subsp. sativus TaxID=79200 RepID=UPI003083E989